MNKPFDAGYYTSDELKTFGFKSIGTNVMIARDCTLINLSAISIGSNVRIDSFTTITSGGVGVTIGNYVHIAAGCYMVGAQGITLKDFSGLSQGVKIYSQSDDYSGGTFTNPTVPKQYVALKTGAVILGKHVIVGSGSVILPGCELAEGTAVGALSVIRKSTHAWKIYLGNPAREIGDRMVIDPDGAVEQELMKKIGSC